MLVVDKPAGPTSHDVVACARRALGVSRIGHTGTLDPTASGVLPLVVGQATRLAQHLSGSDKEYIAQVRFGMTTDTYDASGTVVETTGRCPDASDLAAALAPFIGSFAQVPPAYSAKMVDGARAYERARAGKPVQPEAVVVTCHALDVLAFDAAAALATLRVRCSAGFYVRSLAHDVGLAVGTGAVLAGLERTEAAGFRREHAVSLEWLMSSSRDVTRAAVLGLTSLLTDWPSVSLTDEGVQWVGHGRELGPRQQTGRRGAEGGQVRLLAPDGRLMGIAKPALAPGFLRPVVVFSYS